jgi:hypothetical protein
MDTDGLAYYAKAVAEVVRASRFGFMPRVDVVQMLCQMDLAEQDAQSILAYGLDHGLLVGDGPDLRATPRP